MIYLRLKVNLDAVYVIVWCSRVKRDTTGRRESSLGFLNETWHTEPRWAQTYYACPLCSAHLQSLQRWRPHQTSKKAERIAMEVGNISLAAGELQTGLALRFYLCCYKVWICWCGWPFHVFQIKMQAQVPQVWKNYIRSLHQTQREQWDDAKINQRCLFVQTCKSWCRQCLIKILWERRESCSPCTENDLTPDSSISNIQPLFVTWSVHGERQLKYVFIYIYTQILHYTSDNKAGKSPSTVVNWNKLRGKTPTIWNNSNERN